MKEKFDNQFIKSKIDKLDKHYNHPSYYLEKKIIHEIKSCLLEDALETLEMINSMERAKLSKIPLRSVKNSLIISCALFARAATDANVNAEDVFSMSDVMILTIEAFEDIEKLRAYEATMVKEFIKLIEKSRISNYPYQISTIIKYIHNNITEKIDLEELSYLTGNSKEYISRLFKKELGVTINDYILKEKVEVSKKFLEHSYMNIAEISALFNFCNAAYYTKVFKKYTSQTPLKYRKGN